MPRRTERALVDDYDYQVMRHTYGFEDLQANIVYFEKKVERLMRKPDVSQTTLDRNLFELNHARREYELAVEEYQNFMYSGPR
jgi:hypothetical protein